MVSCKIHLLAEPAKLPFRKWCAAFWCLLILLIVHLVLQLTQYKELEFGTASVNDEYFSLVKDEWTDSAIYDIEISAEACTWPNKPATGRTWNGVEKMRLNAGNYHSGWPAVSYHEFKDGTQLCIVPLGKRYKNIAVIRDASGDAKCPSGTTACSPASVTECVSPDKHDTECPITDIKLVDTSSYVASQHPDYTAVTATDFPQLKWRLLTSRKANFLPLSRFELTEEEPCVLSGAFKIKTNTRLENIPDRTRDIYVNACPIDPLETTMEDTFRLASSSVTVNERTWV